MCTILFRLFMARLSCTKINFGLYIIVDGVNDRYFNFLTNNCLFEGKRGNSSPSSCQKSKLQTFKSSILYNRGLMCERTLFMFLADSFSCLVWNIVVFQLKIINYNCSGHKFNIFLKCFRSVFKTELSVICSLWNYMFAKRKKIP